jgi:uncharacterized protein YgbK (DUF1537 family)
VAAELAAAMACVGASEAFVLPAIPSVGRTTVQGVQHLDGVPLAETAFAHDPLHPITQSSVVAVLERGGLLEGRLLALASVRGGAWEAGWVAAGRPHAVVCDAETDADIEAALRVILRRSRPLVLAGSIGLGRALAVLRAGGAGRRAATAGGPSPGPGPSQAGVLLGVGSIHPASRAQLRAAGRVMGLETVEVPNTAAIAPAAARAADMIGRGLPVALTTPAGRSSAPGLLGEYLADTVAACLHVTVPGGLILIGGETAHRVLARLTQPRRELEARPVPLVVYGRLLDGPYPGLTIATKGGSAGDDEMVIRMIRCFDGKGWR